MNLGLLKKGMKKLRDRQGVNVVIIALLMVLLVGAAALAVDVGMMAVAKNELQNIADAVALGATSELGYQYCRYCGCQDLPPCSCEDTPPGCDIRNYTPNMTEIIEVAQEIAEEHPVPMRQEDQPVLVLAGDIILGKFDPDAPQKIDPAGCGPGVGACDAVRAIVRMDSSANGSMATAFANIFGVTSHNSTADATAALTGPSTFPEGAFDVPFGLSQLFLGPDACDDVIKFHPADSCAGWTSFTEGNPNSSRMRRIMEGLDDGSFESPPVIVGETEFDFTGGVAATLITNENHFDFMDLFDNNKDPATGTWEVNIPIYAESGSCDNPNQSIVIVGGVPAEIYDVEGPSEKEIHARVDCGHVAPGRGGGFSFEDGPLGVIPGLVE